MWVNKDYLSTDLVFTEGEAIVKFSDSEGEAIVKFSDSSNLILKGYEIISCLLGCIAGGFGLASLGLLFWEFGLAGEVWLLGKHK